MWIKEIKAGADPIRKNEGISELATAYEKIRQATAALHHELRGEGCATMAVPQS